MSSNEQRAKSNGRLWKLESNNLQLHIVHAIKSLRFLFPHCSLLFSLLIAYSFLLTGCQKVIELPLNPSEVKYVIEGIVTNEPGFCKVYISKSRLFYEDNNFETVSGAQVKVSDNGQEFLLTETAPGVYETNAINGTPGHQYKLNVQVGGEQFTALSTMPQPVSIDTLYISPGPLGEFKFATVGYTDPAAPGNQYRFVQYLNGVKDPALFRYDDEFNNGRKIIRRLDTGVDKKDDPRAIQTGDTVTIEMQSIDKAVYTYWYSMRTGGGSGSGSAAAPSNPISNIEGGALGYFSAHAVQRKAVVAD